MESFDILIIGGGINGTAIARDAAMRGVSVLLVEKDDLAQHTSSASSKLIHGGLRYLEYYEFRLVREALQEREILLRTAPHLVRPLGFVIPHGRGMRPWWMVRAGLALYDLLAWGSGLPKSRAIEAGNESFRAPLKAEAGRRLACYWDAWVDDSRLVVLNALDAAEHGARIATRTALISARRVNDIWRASLSDGRTVGARAIVNAAGPWVAEVLGQRLQENADSKVRLIKGSHIVVPRLSSGNHAYLLQQPDGRVVFALPYGENFTLVGTTEIPVSTPEEAVISPEEAEYLCRAANLYFSRQITADDIIWSYSGVRSLFDNGAAEAKAVTRDYHLELDRDPGGKLLSVFGGKITTARALAGEALQLLQIGGTCTTGDSALPGGEADDRFELWVSQRSRWLPSDLLARLRTAYGTRLRDLIGPAQRIEDLGHHYGVGLYQAEVDYLLRVEFARTSDDIIWRRTKLGLYLDPEQQAQLAARIG